MIANKGWVWRVCVNCAHLLYRPKKGYSSYICKNPARVHGAIEIDPVLGEVDLRKGRYCHAERGRWAGWTGGCGPSGRFFAAHPVQLSPPPGRAGKADNPESSD